jgi:hypothetical protein
MNQDDFPICTSPIEIEGHGFDASMNLPDESTRSRCNRDNFMFQAIRLDAFHGIAHKRTARMLGMSTSILSLHYFLTLSVYDRSTSQKDKIIFLKPARGKLTIEQKFTDVTQPPDTFHGCYLSVRLGRLDCTTADFSVTITATTAPTSQNVVYDFC